MDPQNIIKKLATDLKCIICGEVFVTPTSISCGHIFCASCVKKWKKVSKKQPPLCPLCNKEILSSVISFNTVDVIENSYKYYLTNQEKNQRIKLEDEREQLIKNLDNDDEGFDDSDDTRFDGSSSESSVDSDLARRFDQLVDESIETSSEEDMDEPEPIENLSQEVLDEPITDNTTLSDQDLGEPEPIETLSQEVLDEPITDNTTLSDQTEEFVPSLLKIRRQPNGSWKILNDSSPMTIQLLFRRLPNGNYKLENNFSPSQVVDHQELHPPKDEQNPSTTLAVPDSSPSSSDDEPMGDNSGFSERAKMLIENMLADIDEKLKADFNANMSTENGGSDIPDNPATPDGGYYSMESVSKEQAENEHDLVLEEILDLKKDLTKKIRNFRLNKSQPNVMGQSQSQDQKNNNGDSDNMATSPSTVIVRSRMVYSNLQVKILEDFYLNKNKYPKNQDCEHLTHLTKLRYRQVKTWFSNRRSKEKRVTSQVEDHEDHEDNCDAFASTSYSKKGKSSQRFPSKSSYLKKN